MRLLVLFAVLLCLAVPAQAEGLLFESAGVAIVQPLSGGTGSFLAYDLSGKALPIEEPESLTLGTIPQYVGANLQGHLLLHSKASLGLPADMNDVKLAVGVSLPLYEAEGSRTAARAGLCYITDAGVGVFASFGVAL